MYLTDALFLNSGAIEDLEIIPEFTGEGLPKPLVLVGGNGSGKTGVLSSFADALMELAQEHFADILPARPNGHSWYKVLGGGTIKNGKTFELIACKFCHKEDDLFFLAKAGSLNPQTVANRMGKFAPIANWEEQGGVKVVKAPNEKLENIFRGGAYAFFPANRAEVPHWLNAPGRNDPEANFDPQFSDKLQKPIVVQNSIQDIKPWIIDIILDQTVDGFTVAQASDLPSLKNIAFLPISRMTALLNLVAIIRLLLKSPTARVMKAGRFSNAQKIQISDSNGIIVQSLNALSSGQATLLSIFATILRYGDHQTRPAAELEGICIVDEVDAHLHSDLQYEILPSLIKFFPSVQFILSTHSPLFVLGMRKAFGDDGFSLVDIPSGQKIDAERFGEFERSYQFYGDTKKFEDEIGAKVQGANRPLILCEGDTDPIYLKTAASLLGFEKLVTDVDIDWVGTKNGGQSANGGKDALTAAFKFLTHNPQFVRSKTILLYDVDTKKKPSGNGNLFERVLPENAANRRCKSGIENLLPEEVFEETFYQTTERVTADVVTVKQLKKTALCQHLCGDAPPKIQIFENFRKPLEELQAIIFPT